MEGPEAVQRATELIEQRLAQEEETEVGARVKGVGEGGFQVKEYMSVLPWERKDMLHGYGDMPLPGPSQAHFHSKMFLTGLWVVRDGASAPQTGTGAGRPSQGPATHLGFGKYTGLDREER